MDNVEYEETGHLDETLELSVDLIKHKAIQGVVALTGRTFILQIIALVATFLLTFFLSTAQYGMFFLVSAVVNFLAYFSDIGLAAALIQKKDKLTQDDLRTTFTIQQMLVLTLVIIIFAGTPLFKSWYKLDQESIYLLWVLGLSLIFSSLKTIPSVLMERRLDFNKLIIPQIVETLLFYTVAVILAWRGLGVTSYTIAVLTRGIGGLVTIYIIQPWIPGFAFSKDSLRSLFKFGLPYQANTFLAMIKDDGMTAFLGTILGPSGIGLLGWANKWGAAPLRFFMDQIIKVTFPAFSRIQDDKNQLNRLVNKSIFFISLIVYPTLMLLAVLAPILVDLIPKYGKWRPALLALSLICLNSAWAAVSTPLTNALNAIGKVSITFKLMIMWTILTWITLPALSYFYGVNGAALGFAIMGFSSVVAIYVAGKYIKLDIFNSAIKPLMASVVMGVVLLIMKSELNETWLSFIVLSIAGMAIYGILIYLMFKEALIESFKIITGVLRKQQSAMEL